MVLTENEFKQLIIKYGEIADCIDCKNDSKKLLGGVWTSTMHIAYYACKKHFDLIPLIERAIDNQEKAILKLREMKII